jgi:CHASE1-domain containing sensor protein
VDQREQLIDIRLNTYIELLRAGAALFAASDKLTGDEFRAFVRGLRVHERYPGIQAIGFAVRIGPERLQAVESQLAANVEGGFACLAARPARRIRCDTFARAARP